MRSAASLSTPDSAEECRESVTEMYIWYYSVDGEDVCFMYPYGMLKKFPQCNAKYPEIQK